MVRTGVKRASHSPQCYTNITGHGINIGINVMSNGNNTNVMCPGTLGQLYCVLLRQDELVEALLT